MPIICAAAFLLLVFLLFKLEKARKKEETLVAKNHDLAKENISLTVRLEEEKKQSVEKIASILEAKEELKSSFKALSHDIFQSSQNSFFSMAKETFEQYQSKFSGQFKEKEGAIDGLLKPIRESLSKVDTQISELEKSRIGAYASLHEQVKLLAMTHQQLEHSTSNLLKALTTPHIRGRWGEIQLKRVVEMAGMVELCDFVTQETHTTDEGGKIRPDLIVRLPNERTIVIDAKVPLTAYLEAIEMQDSHLKNQKMQEHGRQLKKHMGLLGDKAYFETVEKSCELVVLFLPSETIFQAALEQDPTLIEFGVERKVLIATPITLIALLRAVSFGWQEKMVAQHAEKIWDLGRSLYERLITMVDHMDKLKRSLDSSCDAYNKVAGSLESRVLVAARRFQELGVAKEELKNLEPVEKTTAALTIDE